MAYKLNNVYVEDWLTIFPNVEAVDLVVTSPPYYNARKYGKAWDYFKSPKDWYEFCISMLMTLSFVLKDTGVIWWNTGSGYKDGRKMTVIYKLILALEADESLFLIEDFPWLKTSYLPKAFQNRPPAAYEHNLVFGRDPKLVQFYRDAVRTSYAESSLKRMKYPINKMQATEDGEFPERKMVTPHPDGKVPPNYLILNKDNTKRDHPAPMAHGLANWAIRAYSREDDLVLDPMCGIGTTLVEAKKLGRNYLGFDINEAYVDEARKVLEDVSSSNS